ncbi:MAG: hypothetical protein ACP5NX_03140 [Candidatus Bilamarchaeaceae archaeon]
MFDKFKTDEKVMKKEEPKRFVRTLSEEQNIEIKRLSQDESEAATNVMKRAGFDVAKQELDGIIPSGMSYGAYDNRMLIGVALGWAASFDPNSNEIVEGQANAVYLEDPGVLLAYDGSGIRKRLIKAREDDGKSRGYVFAVSYISEEVPRGEIEDYIREAGSVLDRIYLESGYSFFKTRKGLLVVRRL